jgi:iron complex outermembrane receptor protein
MNKSGRKYRSVPVHVKPLAAAVAAAMGLSALAMVPARAQTAIEEITVTATRREATVQDIPFNIAAFSGADLERQGIRSLADFARMVPGLTQVDQGPRGGDMLVVRGLNSDSLNASEFLDNSSGNTVATYIGDIPLYLDMKMIDIERIEVLLGPQGTLYGAGTLGGAIRYLPRRPDVQNTTIDVHARGFGLSKSDGAGFDGDVVVNVPVIRDTLAFRGSVGYLSDPGFIDYNFLVRDPGVSNPQPAAPDCDGPDLRCKKDANDEQTLSGRAALLWNLTDRIEANLTWYYQNQDAGARQITHRAAMAGLPGYNVGKYVSGHRYLEPNERENQLLALEVTAEFDLPILGPAELTSATGWSWYDEVGQRDQTDLLLNFEYGYEDFPSFAAFTREEADEKRFNQELRLVSAGDGPLQWIIGGFYNDYELDAVSTEFTPGIPEFFGVVRPDNIEYIQLTENGLKEVAVFGEVSYRITPPWQVTLGGRWFEYENDANVCFDLPVLRAIFGDPPTGFDFDCQANSVTDDGFLFKFNTSYDVTDNAMVYFTLSEGYRIGGVNSVPPCPDPIPPGQNVCALPNEVLIKPDTTLNYEIGARTTWLNNRLVVNGAVFYVEWDDIQSFSTTVNGGIPITVNGAEARTVGVELAAQARLNENWSLQASYSFTSAELTAFAPDLVDGSDDGRDGDRLPGSPKHQGSLRVNYTQPVFNNLTMDLSYGFTAQSNVYTKVGLRNDGEALDGFVIHNASATLSGEQWEASLYLHNLTDEFAVTAVRQNRTFIRDVGGFRMRRYFENVIRPMEFGATIRYHFDL